MDDDLAAFTAPLSASTEEMHAWSVGRFHLACYLTDSVPPHQYVVSARAAHLVIDGDVIARGGLVVGNHPAPPGPCHQATWTASWRSDETVEDASAAGGSGRDRLEPGPLPGIGVMHLHHIDPMPDGYTYPYFPDVLHVVYAAAPGGYHPELREVDGYELGAELVPVDEARRLGLNAGQHMCSSTPPCSVEHRPQCLYLDRSLYPMPRPINGGSISGRLTHTS